MFWEEFRKYTQARINLGHAGSALPTQEWLDFSLKHAMSIDSIYKKWDAKAIQERLSLLGIDAKILNSAVKNREEYLLRPDLGCYLNQESYKKLKKNKSKTLMVLISNGLSTQAVENHLFPLLESCVPFFRLVGLKTQYYLIPDARVGIIDCVGEVLAAELGVIFIGERPGLSSTDSLGAYLTFQPKSGLSNADRNCISNIRSPFGLSYEEAAKKISYLMQQMLMARQSGFMLKDCSAQILKA